MHVGENPAIEGLDVAQPRLEHELADPFVLKWNGQYFVYFSGSPIVAYQSTDLVHWDLVGPVLQASDSPNAWNQIDVWAPEVVYRNGKFYMYYTASRKSDDWRVGEMARRIGVAVSDSPRGPFVDSGKTCDLSITESIPPRYSNRRYHLPPSSS